MTEFDHPEVTCEVDRTLTPVTNQLTSLQYDCWLKKKKKKKQTNPNKEKQ